MGYRCHWCNREGMEDAKSVLQDVMTCKTCLAYGDLPPVESHDLFRLIRVANEFCASVEAGARPTKIVLTGMDAARFWQLRDAALACRFDSPQGPLTVVPEAAHQGDRCQYCGALHDEVVPGPCPGLVAKSRPSPTVIEMGLAQPEVRSPKPTTETEETPDDDRPD